MKLRYDKTYDYVKSKEELFWILTNHERIDLEIPFDSINITSSHLDVMQDYLDVSYISENIAKYSEIIDYGNMERDKYYLSFNISFKPLKAKELTNFIYRNCKSYSDICELNEDEQFEYSEKITEYESKLESTDFCFPDLIDSYYANLVNAGYYQIAADYYDDEEEYLEAEFKKYPERRYGFWKSAASHRLKCEIFVSTESWIIPTKYNIEEILKKYYAVESGLAIQYAGKFEYKGRSLFSHRYCAVWDTINSDLSKARNCATIALGRFIEVAPRKETKYLLSELGNLLVVEDTFFYYVFFLSNAKLNFNELSNLRDYLNPVYENINYILGLSDKMEFDWSGFNDEKFEQLCYDILYFHPKFDNSTIRKMGKSRSRDGGRDITVWTRQVSGKEPELFIFQCKFYRPNSSLSASKVGDAANTIMQYGARGYGVFTTGVIDATLYDMLDGFANNYKISTRENWSIFEIERYLSRNKTLIKKYFNK